MTSDTPPTWEEQLGEQAAAALAANPSLPRSRQRPTLTLISWNRSVADSQKVYRIEHGARPSDRYVLLVSPQDFPDASADEAARMQAMKARLGPRTGRVILDVLGQGRVGGRSFFIVPHCRPLPHGRFAGRIARWRAQGPVLQWLREVCALGVGTPHTAHRTPHTAHRTPHTAHRTPHTAHRTPHTAHRTPHTRSFSLLSPPCRTWPRCLMGCAAPHRSRHAC